MAKEGVRADAPAGGRVPTEVERLADEVATVRERALAAASTWADALAELDPVHWASGHNLAHYLGFRSRDLRQLQTRLTRLGLSSLGRAEPHVLATLDAVLAALHGLSGQLPERALAPVPSIIDFESGQRRLANNTDRLLGPPSPGRTVRIMVTMPTEAADDYSLVENLVRHGMNVMRINCAHDDPDHWLRMIGHVRRAERALGATCRVLMDLAGPKPRTGPVEPGAAVVKIRPERDALGRVTAPARVWLTDRNAPSPPLSEADAVLPVSGSWLASLEAGARVTFRDAREARRELRVVDVTAGGAWAELMRTAYVVPGTRLRRVGGGARRGRRRKAKRDTRVGDLPATPGEIRLDRGDVLLLVRGAHPGHGAVRDSAGRLLSPAFIGCTLDRVFDDVRPGESIWFDDGKFGGLIDRVELDRIWVRITHAPLGGARLKADKGINLPDTELHVPALTPKDRQDLPFVMAHADLVGLSFVSGESDVRALHEAMARIGGRQPGVVLKIENRRGFERLPEILMAAMRRPACGVMIARGDLAVEAGFERLAEVQEEILWACEAAHLPVIWATQVLETLAKRGTPSRAEITDAAMGHRAECVMLNKGPHVLDAVRTLDDILRRMEPHQAKKRSMLRALSIATAQPPDVRSSTTAA